MEDIKELFELLFKYGGTALMAVLFVVYLFLDRKDRKEEKAATNAILKELSVSNKNVSDSLNLLKTSIDNTNNEFKQHDERAIKNFQGIHEDLIILKERK